ncbi:MAG: hypothetical protein ACRDFX_07310 [Chloroflexota bacterium]
MSQPAIGVASANQPDPLGSWHGRPMISHPSQRGNFVGRVVIELWDQGDAAPSRAPSQRDAAGLVLLVDPAIDAVPAPELLSRVVASLPLRFPE